MREGEEALIKVSRLAILALSSSLVALSSSLVTWTSSSDFFKLAVAIWSSISDFFQASFHLGNYRGGIYGSCRLMSWSRSLTIVFWFTTKAIGSSLFVDPLPATLRKKTLSSICTPSCEALCFKASYFSYNNRKIHDDIIFYFSCICIQVDRYFLIYACIIWPLEEKKPLILFVNYWLLCNKFF